VTLRFFSPGRLSPVNVGQWRLGGNVQWRERPAKTNFTKTGLARETGPPVLLRIRKNNRFLFKTQIPNIMNGNG
jgi:hypothetical protein